MVEKKALEISRGRHHFLLLLFSFFNCFSTNALEIMARFFLFVGLFSDDAGSPRMIDLFITYTFSYVNSYIFKVVEMNNLKKWNL